MKLKAGGVELVIEEDEINGWMTSFVLPVWKEFGCENSLEDAAGEKLFVVLQPEEDSSPEEIGADAYSTALEWILGNSEAIREASLASIFSYIHDTLIGEYGLDDPELLEIKSPSQLKTEIDPSYLRLFPYSKNGVPYFALEFECSWDPEHGCGVMFYGNDVVDVGVSDSAQGAFDILGHGGKI